jgi:orotate phosphoribosyltransferase-like protein
VRKKWSLVSPRAGLQTNGVAMMAMTADEFTTALKVFALTPHQKAAAQMLGISLRQCQRYSAGEAVIPASVDKLMERLLHERLTERNPKKKLSTRRRR